MPNRAASRRDWTTRSAEAGSARLWVRSSTPRDIGTVTGAARAGVTTKRARNRGRMSRPALAGLGPARLQREPPSRTLGAFLAPGCCRTCAQAPDRLTGAVVPPTGRPPRNDPLPPSDLSRRPPGRADRARRGGHVDVRQLSQRPGEGEVRVLAGQGVAGPRAALERAAGARVLGELRLPGWAGDDQPPLRPPLHPGPVDRAAGPDRERLLRQDPGRGAHLPANGDQPARRDP